MARFRLRTLILAVAVMAILLALVAQSMSYSRRVSRLEARLRDAEARHLEYRARVEEMLRHAEIRVAPGSASPGRNPPAHPPAADPPVAGK